MSSTTTTDELNPAIGAMRNPLSASTVGSVSIAPQVIVVYKNHKKAYGRLFLKSLGYCGALRKLREQFGLRNGKAPEATWDKNALATFARTHGHSDRDAVILDEASWDELIDNVAKIELDPHGPLEWMPIIAITIILLVLIVYSMAWVEII